MNNQPIGIFDSGVGGLSVLASVKKLLPDEAFVYFADQKNSPYGGRSVEEIQNLSSRVCAFLLSKKVKLIIIACNTVSVNAVDYLRSQYDAPIIAVVPVVKTIAEKSRTKKAAVFATPATADSKYLEDLIKKFSNATEIYKIGTSKLEYLVEEGIVSGPKVREALENSLLPLLSKNVDSIALGCTHYPFLRDEIKKVVGDKMDVYDSGGAIARRTKFVLGQEDMLALKKGEDYYYTTGSAERFEEVAEKLMNLKIENVEEVEI
jgi:glutamate racemase